MPVYNTVVDQQNNTSLQKLMTGSWKLIQRNLFNFWLLQFGENCSDSQFREDFYGGRLNYLLDTSSVEGVKAWANLLPNSSGKKCENQLLFPPSFLNAFSQNKLVYTEKGSSSLYFFIKISFLSAIVLRLLCPLKQAFKFVGKSVFSPM